MRSLLCLALTLLALSAAAQKGKPTATDTALVTKSVFYSHATQERARALGEKVEELQAVSKLIKKNADVNGIVQQRIGLLSQEWQDLMRTFYETNQVDPALIKRDSVAGETLILFLRKSPLPPK